MRGTAESARSFYPRNFDGWRLCVDTVKDRGGPPPPVFSAPPERSLERELKKKPDDPDVKADVGSDESMDASDPPTVVQPGCSNDPVPSSGFPE
jgi:hypothetical protein